MAIFPITFKQSHQYFIKAQKTRWSIRKNKDWAWVLLLHKRPLKPWTTYFSRSQLWVEWEKTHRNEKFPKIVHLNFFAKFVSAAILSKMNEIFLGHFFPFLQISSFSKDDDLITTSIETFLVSTFTFTLKVWLHTCPAIGFLSEGDWFGSRQFRNIWYKLLLFWLGQGIKPSWLFIFNKRPFDHAAPVPTLLQVAPLVR